MAVDAIASRPEFICGVLSNGSSDPYQCWIGEFIPLNYHGTWLIFVYQAVNQDWGTGGNGLLYALWGFWWLDSAVSYLCAFGMLYTM